MSFVCFLKLSPVSLPDERADLFRVLYSTSSSLRSNNPLGVLFFKFLRMMLSSARLRLN